MQRRAISWACEFALHSAVPQPFRRWPLFVLVKLVEARYFLIGRI